MDDTPLNLSVIEGLLKSTLVVIEKATSGEQALSLAKDAHYDLILMDQRMPVMSGTETLRRLRAPSGGKNRSTPAICLTADAVQNARSRYLNEGFTDYLSKPVEGGALEKILVQYLPREKVFPATAGDAQPIDAQNAQEKRAPEKDASGKSARVQKVPADDVRARYAKTPQLDYAEAEKYLATDELIEDTLRQFFENIRENADEIERLWKAGDYENYTIRVHALKSAARMVGLTALSAQAEKLEAAGNALLESKK